MKYTIEVEAEGLSDIVNLLREITRLVREARIVFGREVQYCMGAYRVVEGDGVWNAAVESALEKLRAEAKRLHDFGDEYDQLIVDRLNVVAAHVAALRVATESNSEGEKRNG
ncbi:MAG TPA: hypothetical protein VM580_21120 [Labilithrix sp.]|jgi:hypothetical protein|nr:hypothetical protein [Labilithrix sp.]